MPMTVMQWRRIVKSYAGAAMSDIAMEPWDGPAAVRVVFYLRKPKEPHCNTSPDTKPDLDKLLRALGDALEGSVVTQDSRIVEWSGIKRWARPGEERVDVEVALL